MRGPWIVIAVCGLALLLMGSSGGWFGYAVRVLALLGLVLGGLVLIAGSIRKRDR